MATWKVRIESYAMINCLHQLDTLLHTAVDTAVLLLATLVAFRWVGGFTMLIRLKSQIDYILYGDRLQ